MNRYDRAIIFYDGRDDLPFADLIVYALRMARDVDKYSRSSNIVKVIKENEMLKEKLSALGISTETEVEIEIEIQED